MIRPIVTNETSEGIATLTRKSEKVGIKENIADLISDLTDTATSLEITKIVDEEEVKLECIGLTAIQIGIPKRVCIIKAPESDPPGANAGKWITLINPIIVDKSNGSHISSETCFSVLGEPRQVKRWDWITVMNQVGKRKVRIKFTGMRAVAVQHEIDHMNGVLI